MYIFFFLVFLVFSNKFFILFLCTLRRKFWLSFLRFGICWWVFLITRRVKLVALLFFVEGFDLFRKLNGVMEIVWKVMVSIELSFWKCYNVSSTWTRVFPRSDTSSFPCSHCIWNPAGLYSLHSLTSLELLWHFCLDVYI